MLSQSGITSVCCLQLDEVLDALRTQHFDLLLTDVQMPALSGFDLLSLLRASNIPQAISIPIIAVTARSDMKSEDFLAHGFSGCLHKPFSVNELLSAVKEIGLEVSAPSLQQAADEAVKENFSVSATLNSSSSALNFSALTAFSADDPEAADSILRSFASETRLNAERLQKAVNTRDMDDIAAVSHKMIPLFTLIGAKELVNHLKLLETSNGKPFAAEQEERALAALTLIENIIQSLPTIHA